MTEDKDQTSMGLSKGLLNDLRELGAKGEPAQNILRRIVDRVKSPKIDASLKIEGLRDYIERFVREYVESQLVDIREQVTEVTSIYKTVVKPHDQFKKREAERITHGKSHFCVCTECNIEVEVSDAQLCAETECSKCGKKMTDKPIERTKEAKAYADMTSNELEACEELSPEEKKRLISKRLRKVLGVT